MSSRVLTGGRHEADRSPGNVAAAWRSLGWFGAAVALIGLGQLVLYFVPTLAFGSPEWEYGASAQALGALPLPTIGLAAVLAAAFALGVRWLLITVGVLLLVLGVAAFATLALFWSVAPMALRATPEAVAGPIQQTIGRTTLNGVGFSLLYLSMAWRALRRAGR